MSSTIPNSTPEIVDATWPTARFKDTATPARATPKISVVIVVRIGSVSASPTPAIAAAHPEAAALWTPRSSANASASAPKPPAITGPRRPSRSESAPVTGAAAASPTLISDAIAPAAALVKRNSLRRYVGSHAVIPYALNNPRNVHEAR